MISDVKSPTGGLLSGQKLFGCKVENPRGEGLGRIEDIMFSAEGGQVAYAVVSFGGVLSLGNKLFAFPWSALHVDSPRKKVILNLDKKTLAKAHGFDKDHWPDSSDWNWGASVPSPSPSVTAVPERAAGSGIPAVRVEAQKQEAPSPSASPVLETSASARSQMEQWGKSWQSHGLDRS
jgi:sporulation protein YlmC with PRC-barrel domain